MTLRYITSSDERYAPSPPREGLCPFCNSEWYCWVHRETGNLILGSHGDCAGNNLLIEGVSLADCQKKLDELIAMLEEG
jgi:hypothetical protein